MLELGVGSATAAVEAAGLMQVSETRMSAVARTSASGYIGGGLAALASSYKR